MTTEKTLKKNPLLNKALLSNSTYLSAFILSIVLFFIFVIFVPGFGSLLNLMNLASRSATNLILAIGMTYILICGEIDLSMPGLISLSAVICAILLTSGVAIIPSVMIILALGCFVGFINGYLSTKIPSFVATLGMLSVTKGIALYITNGMSIHNLPENFLLIERFRIGAIPISAVDAVIILILAIVVSKRMIWGRHIYALGGNRQAARSAGIPIERRLIQAYIILGCLGSFVALLLTAKLNAAHPLLAENASFDAITAVVIGGTSLFGGRGHVLGSAAGALIITMLSNTFVLLSLPASLQGVISGLILILVIFVDYLRSKK